MRTFLAFNLSEEIKEEIQRIAFGIPNMKWVKSDNYHITIKFLGEVSEQKLEEVVEVMSEVSPFSENANLLAPNFFEGPRETVLHLNIRTSSPTLENFYFKSESLLSSIGFPMESRSYIPHVTIGRFSGKVNNRILIYCQEFKDFISSSFELKEFSLFQSILKPGGANYEEIHRFLI